MKRNHKVAIEYTLNLENLVYTLICHLCESDSFNWGTLPLGDS